MFSALNNHPFAVEAFFERSIILTFAVPQAQLRPFVHERLELDVFNDIAFIAVAMVQTKDLRPKGFPAFMGNNFFLIGYRIFVRYTDKRGKRLRGLYILKSETNKRKMEILGNIFTHYNYTTTDINCAGDSNLMTINSQASEFSVRLSLNPDAAGLPENSPFTDWGQARRYAGPLPFTFSIDGKNVLIIEGVRKEWQPKPIHIDQHHFSFLNSLNVDYSLANAFAITNTPYYWKKGRIEQW